jgi:hypothetical protein
VWLRKANRKSKLVLVSASAPSRPAKKFMSCEVTLGEHGRLTPDAARREAKKLLGAVETGADPIAARRGARAIPLFREVADDFMRTHIAAKKKARTHESYETLLRLYILPAIGHLQLTKIRRAQVSKMHSRAEHPGEANRALAVRQSGTGPQSSMTTSTCHSTPRRGSSAIPNPGKSDFLAATNSAASETHWPEPRQPACPIRSTKPTAKHAPRPSSRCRTLDPFAVAAIRMLLFTGARLREIPSCEVGVCRLRARPAEPADIEDREENHIPVGRRA